MNLSLIFVIAALVVFLLAVFNLPTRISLIALGLALLTLARLVGGAVLVLCLLILSSCSTTTGDVATDTRNAKINATGSYIIQKVGTIALNTVLTGLTSQTDQSTKTDYLQGLALAFRSQEGSLITSDDVKNLVSIWTPSAPHWATFGTQIAQLVANADPQTPAQAKQILESIAQGLDQVTTSNP